MQIGRVKLDVDNELKVKFGSSFVISSLGKIDSNPCFLIGNNAPFDIDNNKIKINYNPTHLTLGPDGKLNVKNSSVIHS